MRLQIVGLVLVTLFVFSTFGECKTLAKKSKKNKPSNKSKTEKQRQLSVDESGNPVTTMAPTETDGVPPEAPIVPTVADAPLIGQQPPPPPPGAVPAPTDGSVPPATTMPPPPNAPVPLTLSPQAPVPPEGTTTQVPLSCEPTPAPPQDCENGEQDQEPSDSETSRDHVDDDEKDDDLIKPTTSKPLTATSAPLSPESVTKTPPKSHHKGKNPKKNKKTNIHYNTSSMGATEADNKA